MFAGVDGIRDNIIDEMNRGRGLEAVLGELVRSQDPNIRRQVFEIPIYLKVLLGDFSSAGRAGTYDALITLIQRRSLSVTFVTLNYDTLLDKAIERKFAAPMKSMDDFVRGVNVRGWNYIKLHGSVNWGYPLWEPKMGIKPLEDSHIAAYLSELGYELDDVADVQRDPSRIALLASERSLSTGDVLVYPALAIPTDQKNETVCPPEHVAVLRSALESDPAVLVIGNQGLDTDLMDILRDNGKPAAPWWERDATDILRDAVGATSGKPLLVVDPGDTSEVAVRFTRALHRSDFNYTGLSVGFREFVESEEAARFFDDVAASALRESVAPPQPQHR